MSLQASRKQGGMVRSSIKKGSNVQEKWRKSAIV
jgi:hypothetical protein